MKQQFHLISEGVKQNAINFIRSLPVDEKRPLVLDIKEMTRTLAQNRMLWSCLNDVSEQVVWYGRKLNSESWKHIFSASLKGQQTVPGIDGGFVVLGHSTSKMRVSEMRDLITLIHAFGSERNVQFSDESACAREWAIRFGGENAQ